MSGDKDFLDEFEAEDIGNDAIVEQPTESEMEPVRDGPARGPDGKFVKAEAEAKAEEVETGAKEAAEANHAEPPSDDEQEGQSVPVTALTAERKKRQELEARLAALEGKQTQPQSTSQEQPQFIDPNEDPFGYLMQNIQSMEQAQENQHLNMSEMFARQQAGDEPVDAAIAAFNEYRSSLPPQMAENFRMGIVSSQHPYRELLKWHQNQKDLQRIQEAGGLEQYMKAQMANMQQPQAQPQTQQGRTNVPPSLASSGKATSTEPTAAADPFDELFS